MLNNVLNNPQRFQNPPMFYGGMTNPRAHHSPATISLDGSVLAHLRNQRGWSGDDLGDKLNVSKQAISRWENYQIPEKKIAAVLKLMGVTPDEWEQIAQSLNNSGLYTDHAATVNYWYNQYSSELKSFIVPDETMNPWAAQGEIVLYDETTPPRRGDGCIIKTKSGESFCRIYQSRDSVNWHFHSLNPDTATTLRYDLIETVSKIVLRGG